MVALVTGGSGFLGGWIVGQLRERGEWVRALQRSPSPALEDLGVEVLQGDIEDPSVGRRAVRGVDVVFHTAGRVGLFGPWAEYERTNVIGTRNLLDACLAERVGRFVFTSSPQVVFSSAPIEGGDEDLPYAPRYFNPYARSKALAEQAVLAAHEPGRLHTIALRPHFIWGPGDNALLPRIIEAARTGRVRRVGRQDNRVSLSYVEDVAAAHLLAAVAIESPRAPAGGKAFFVNDAEPVAFWGFIDRVLADLRLPPITGQVSFETAWRLGAALEVVHKVLRLRGEPRMTRFLAATLGLPHWFKTERARRDLAWRPEVGAEEGYRRTMAWLQAGALQKQKTFL